MNKLRIGIVDDQPKVAQQILEKLSFYPEIEVSFNLDRGEKVLQWLGAHNEHPQVILMDIEMPQMDGIETTFRIRQSYPGIQVLMLTVFDDEANIYHALQAGASGYFLKEERALVIRQALDELRNNGNPMSPSVASKVLRMMLGSYRPQLPRLFELNKEQQLSDREIEILELLSKGLKNTQVASSLFISEATVKKHIENIYQKVQAGSRVALINWYNNKKAGI